MSFSQRTKKEISIKNILNQNLIYELFSYLKLCGYIRIIENKIYILFDVESNIQSKRIYNIIRTLFSFSPTIEIKNNKKFSKDKFYRVLVDDEIIANKILGLSEKIESDIKNLDLKDENTLNSIFLKVGFLLSGSITDPKRGYNVEFYFSNKELSDKITYVLNYFELNPKMILRNGNFIVYLKDSNKISDFLSIITAYNALLELENVKAMKELRNDINRQTNCDKANIDRTVKASIKQVNSIQKIIDKKRFNELSDDLKIIAKLRIDNPYLSISDLGNLLVPKMSKAKVNYRLQKLINFSEEI